MSNGQRIDPTGDERAAMLAALEYGVHPMVRETLRLRPDHPCDLCPRDFATRAALANHYRFSHP
jgi:hypothetical protein